MYVKERSGRHPGERSPKFHQHPTSWCRVVAKTQEKVTCTIVNILILAFLNLARATFPKFPKSKSGFRVFKFGAGGFAKFSLVLHTSYLRLHIWRGLCSPILLWPNSDFASLYLARGAIRFALRKKKFPKLKYSL